MLVWLPRQELADRLGALPGVDLEVITDWRTDALPASAAHVEVVVLPRAGSPELGAVLARLPRLRAVQMLSAGVEAVRGAVPDGVALLNARGVHTPSTSEWVCAAVLSCQRDFPRFLESQAARRWDPAVARTLDGATVLLVGVGSIGSAVEERLRPFGCRFLRVARRERDGVRTLAALPQLLPQADVVVLLVPLTVETTRLADAHFLSSMRDGALLVNASRGPVVDTGALLEELTALRLRAALDVTDPEPLPEDHPLWSAPGLLMTPHVGGAVPTMLDRQAALLAERLPRWAAGERPSESVHDGY